MTIRPADERDLQAVRSLLAAENLPTDIVDERKGLIWVVDDAGTIAGAGALELYGADALLRSLVIAPGKKARGWGSRMVRDMETFAAESGVKTLWLLTETAEQFFAVRGYTKVDRTIILNQGILDSAEFKHLCASTAVCMRKDVRRVGREP